mmetsp:Transcript_30956/g.90517  ORF Transcript_30956/g.90517 Transcript_30956/m.90517 type:complete len:374 (-) Transcript_30956:56-1177(-)
MPDASDVPPEAAAADAASAAKTVEDAVADTFVADPSCDDARHSSRSRSRSRKEFPFFKERRDPFFWFNNVCFLFAFGAFVYFTITIVWDYIKQRNDPPTATNLVTEPKQLFPGMAFCTHQAEQIDQPDLLILFAEYDNGFEVTDVSSQFKKVECPSNPLRAECWYLDGNFAAFQFSEPHTCSHRNSLSIGLSFNGTLYSSNVMLVGVDGYLFLSGRSEQVINSACGDEFPTCSSLVPIDEANDCGPDKTDLSLDYFFATNALSNLISLERTERQTKPQCSESSIQWNPTTSLSNYNPAFFLSKNISISDAESAVLMHFQFSSPTVAKTTYNPQSGPSMFGSLSGWFGFLSDGWGIISLLFISEELANWVRAIR